MNDIAIALLLIAMLVTSLHSAVRGPFRAYSLLFLVLFVIGFLSIQLSAPDTTTHYYGSLILIVSFVVGVTVLAARVWCYFAKDWRHKGNKE